MTSDTVTSVGKPGGYMHQHRIKLAIWIAVAEGVLVLFGVIPHLAIYALAIIAVVFYVAMARNYRSNTARQLAWIFAASQLLTVLIPAVWFIAKSVAIVAIFVIAIAGLVFLFTERDRHHNV